MVWKAGESSISSRWGREFVSLTVALGPSQSNYPLGAAGKFSRDKAAGDYKLTNHPHQAPKVTMDGDKPSLPYLHTSFVTWLMIN
jgi:hypothetical protein